MVWEQNVYIIVMLTDCIVLENREWSGNKMSTLL